jgi:hypothetical protein
VLLYLASRAAAALRCCLIYFSCFTSSLAFHPQLYPVHAAVMEGDLAALKSHITRGSGLSTTE